MLTDSIGTIAVLDCERDAAVRGEFRHDDEPDRAPDISSFNPPVMRSTLVKLQLALSSRALDLATITEAVKKDPALALYVIRRAADLFRDHAQRLCVDDVIVHIGREELQALLVEVPLMRGRDLVAYEHLWDHSIDVARKMSMLASNFAVCGEHAYLAGLLHDLETMRSVMLNIGMNAAPVANVSKAKSHIPRCVAELIGDVDDLASTAVLDQLVRIAHSGFASRIHA